MSNKIKVRLLGKNFEISDVFTKSCYIFVMETMREGEVLDGYYDVVVSQHLPEWSEEKHMWTPRGSSTAVRTLPAPLSPLDLSRSLQTVYQAITEYHKWAVKSGVETLLPETAEMPWAVSFDGTELHGKSKAGMSKTTKTPIEELRVYTWGNGKHKYIRINGIKYWVVGGNLVEVDVECFLSPNEESHTGFRYLSDL